MPRLTSVCVFCGSNPGRRPEYLAGAADLGRILAGRGIRVVYGGAHVGLMGALADAVLAAGGEIIGVIPRLLADAEVAHPGLTELRVTRTMHERKEAMAARADAFLTLPGGTGTLDEFVEALSWTQLGQMTSSGRWSVALDFSNPAAKRATSGLVAANSSPRCCTMASKSATARSNWSFTTT